MLAAFAVMPPGQAGLRRRAASRSRTCRCTAPALITVTEDTLAFGFRAASAADGGGICPLAGLADLDLMQARRHARFLAGHALSADLRALREAAPGQAARGLAAVAAGWADRQARAGGTATMVDVGDDGMDLAAAAAGRIVASPASMAGSSASARRLAGDPGPLSSWQRRQPNGHWRSPCACARGLGRYRWEGTIGTARIMAAATWDLFPLVTWDDTSCHQPASLAGSQERSKQR